jgi:hypothetical protein
MPKDYGEAGPNSTPDSPWISSASPSSSPGLTGSGGGATIASS